ncbi:MAG: hypothetical protein LC107_05510 [Chitinophagales bacterium]|nr:hypothetical protein [Chitinophagales bacterium]
MKKVIAIFFLFSFLSANTAFGEVLKLPLLIHHYFEHSQEDDDNSIIDFLAKHYGKDINHHHNDSHHDHDKLPFKTFNPHSVNMFDFQPLFNEVSIPLAEKELKTPVLQQQIYHNDYLDSIWQPPQVS